MQTNVSRLRDATTRGNEEVLTALTDVDYDVRMSQDLLDAVLDYHRGHHTTVSPRFCEPMCRIAAEW